MFGSLNVILELPFFKHLLAFTAFIFKCFCLTLFYEGTFKCQRWEYSAASKLNGVSRGCLCPVCEVDPLIFNISLSLCFFAGGQCGCPSYSALLYALSSAVAVLLLLLLGLVVLQVSGLIMLLHMRGKIKLLCCHEQHLPVESVP